MAAVSPRSGDPDADLNIAGFQGHKVAVVSLADAESVPLAGGSRSKVLVAEHTVDGSSSALGCSVFRPGTFPSPGCPPTERREPASAERREPSK